MDLQREKEADKETVSPLGLTQRLKLWLAKKRESLEHRELLLCPANVWSGSEKVCLSRARGHDGKLQGGCLENAQGRTPCPGCVLWAAGTAGISPLRDPLQLLLLLVGGRS